MISQEIVENSPASLNLRRELIAQSGFKDVEEGLAYHGPMFGFTLTFHVTTSELHKLLFEGLKIGAEETNGHVNCHKQSDSFLHEFFVVLEFRIVMPGFFWKTKHLDAFRFELKHSDESKQGRGKNGSKYGVAEISRVKPTRALTCAREFLLRFPSTLEYS